MLLMLLCRRNEIKGEHFVKKLIYSSYGVAVLEMDGKLNVSWPTGICSIPVYYVISEESLEKLKRSEKDA